QTPSPEVFDRSLAGPISQRVFAPKAGNVVARWNIADGRTGRSSKEKRLVADAEEGRRRVGPVGFDRCVRIRSIENVARILGCGDGYTIDVAFNVGEVARRELGQHLLADVRHVQLDDRE